jgi:orotidine-5'-phosphate decarboxylase
MTKQAILDQIKLKKSYLCVGLDTDIDNIPKEFLSLEDPIFEFNKCIIDATLPYAVAYKINTAFYEAQGLKGWAAMEKTVNYLPDNVFKIADAKRGDIGNTSAQYAKAFFETLNFDAITVSPYMGSDSILPFYNYPNKWVIILGLTSNVGAADFELQKIDNQYLFEKVIATASQYGNHNNTIFVVGATQNQYLHLAKAQCPNHILLVPGVGFQGGSLSAVSSACINQNSAVLINVSRAIIYSSPNKANLATEAAAIAQQYVAEMSNFIP